MAKIYVDDELLTVKEGDLGIILGALMGHKMTMEKAASDPAIVEMAASLGKILSVDTNLACKDMVDSLDRMINTIKMKEKPDPEITDLPNDGETWVVSDGRRKMLVEMISSKYKVVGVHDNYATTVKELKQMTSAQGNQVWGLIWKGCGYVFKYMAASSDIEELAPWLGDTV